MRDLYVKASAPSPSTSKLNKTGQTTSYATSDDGGTQRGKLANFTTLASNNPFGNTNRFTNKTGGSTFTASVAYDWSTFDGSSVLAYYWGDLSYRTFANACTALTSSTIDGLTGWYLWNINEAVNVMNFSLHANFMLNYAPFSTNRRYFWLATSPSGTAGMATDMAGLAFVYSTNKSNTNQGIFVRVCSVTGTTIS